MEAATVEAGESIRARNFMIEAVESQIDRKKRLEDALKSF
jgi:hypothetical protein